MSRKPSILSSAVRRLVRRDLLANKGRTLAVFLLTFIPLLLIFAVTHAIANDGSSSVSTEERVTRELGTADASIFDIDESSLSRLPGNPEIASWSDTGLTVGQVSIRLTDFPAESDLVVGTWQDLASPKVVQGANPLEPTDVAASPLALAAIGSELGVGDTFIWGDQELTIVGILDEDSDSVANRSGEIRFSPGSLNTGYSRTLVKWTSDDRPSDQQLERLPFQVDTQTEIGEEQVYNSGEPAPGFFGAILMFGLSIATGAVAFVAWRTSASRRLRDVGLLASSGATNGQLVAVQAMQGFVVAATATAAAIAAWLAALQVPSLSLALTPGSPLDPIIDVAGILFPSLIAVGAATVAAALPAWQAARVPLSSTLAGRFVTSKQNPLSPVLGLVLMFTGFLMLAFSVQSFSNYAVLLLGGGGMAAIAIGALPILTVLFRAGDYRPIGDALPVTQRLAVRSLARHAGRSAAAVLGIGAVVAAVWAGSIDAQQNLDGEGGFGDWTQVGVRSDGGSSEVDLSLFEYVDRSAVVEGVYVTINNPDAHVRAEQARLLLEGEPAAQRFELQAYENAQFFGPIQLDLDPPVEDPALAAAIQAGLPSGSNLTGFGMFEDFGTQSLSNENRRPAFDTTIVALPVDIDADLLEDLTSNTQLLVTGIGRDLPLDVEDNLRGDRQAQLVLTAIGVVVAAFVIALVVYVMLQEAREESALLTSLGSKTSVTSQFLSTQVFLISSSGILAGLVVGTLIRFAVDTGFYLPTQVLVVLVALPFVLAAMSYPVGWSRSGGQQVPRAAFQV